MITYSRQLLLMSARCFREPAQSIDHASVGEHHAFVSVHATGKLRRVLTPSAMTLLCAAQKPHKLTSRTPQNGLKARLHFRLQILHCKR